jgi:hypothetical protein
MARSTLIRNEPCPRCGSYMIWTENVWKVPAAQGSDAGPDRVAAYVCENPTCGLALDPAKHPRDRKP